MGEMVQKVKCLLWTREEPDSDPTQKPGVAIHIWKPTAWNGGQKQKGLEGEPAEPTNVKFQVQQETLSQG